MLLGLAFVLLPTVVLAGAWRLGGVSALEDDLLYYLPVRDYIGRCIRAGEWPTWNPLAGMGTSLAADPQAGLYYPPTYLFVVLPPLVAYPLTVVLHFALAGWGMYRLLRSGRQAAESSPRGPGQGQHDAPAEARDSSGGVGPEARGSSMGWQIAFLGAVAFEFSGFLIAHRVHLTMFEAAAWLPWILFGWERFARSGRYRDFALAVILFGLQMLVQHTQVSIMTGVLLTGYVLFVLLPRRKSLLWQYPIGLASSIGMAAAQFVPTAYHLLASGRAEATYATFVENAWSPASAMLMLFPMVFGNRTPGPYGQAWWGWSHFCEQSVYASILVLVLAAASVRLLRRNGRWDRGLLFWWAAGAVALLMAMGDLTPLSRLMFHVPVYRSLRAPARWLIVWSVAMPILATAVLWALQRADETSEKLRRTVRWILTRGLPVAAGLCIVVLVAARLSADRLEAAYGDRWGAATMLAGLRSAVRPDNPAILWPLVVMTATAIVLLAWMRRRDGRSFAALFAVMLIDLAGVAAFVDIDTTTYTRGDLQRTPPLGPAIASMQPQPGHRLLVPRTQADYERPIEVLWPETNIRHDVATFNAYGPFWPRANRLAFRFMAWGASEDMLWLLRNRPLCEAMGIRFLAARSADERALVRAALAPAVEDGTQTLCESDIWHPVRAGQDILWPIRIDEAGIYRLRFDAAALADAASQWYVGLETPDTRGIGWSRRLEPVDLSAGPRQMEFLFVCAEAIGEARVRIKAEFGAPLSVRSATFARVAKSPVDVDEPVVPDASSGVLNRGSVAGGIELYELPGAVGLLRTATDARAVLDLAAAVDFVRYRLGHPGQACYEWDADRPPPSFRGTASDTVAYKRRAGHDIRAHVRAASGGLLIFNETYDAGWRATVNGEPADVLRVNGVVQGVILPPGASEVHFVYAPRGWRAGILISALVLALLVVGGLWRGKAAR